MQVNWKDKTYDVAFGRFKTGNSVALILKRGHEDERPSVNIPDMLDDDELAIKNYSELSGILDALFEAKVIEHPHRFITNEAVDFPIVRLTEEALDLLADAEY